MRDLAMTAVQIVCPTCATAYDVSASSLGSEGRSVRCARCRNVWFAAAPVPAEAAAIDAEWARPPDPNSATDWDEGTEAAKGANGSGDEANNEWSAIETDWGAETGQEASEEPSPPLAPGLEEQPVVDASSEAKDIESVAARRRGRRGFSYSLVLPRHGLAAAILVLIAVNIALIAWRENIVRALPQTGSLYALIGMPVNLRGLSITNIATSREAIEGVPVLIVEGTVKNTSKKALEVPRIRFSLRNRAGAEIYAWTSMPPRTILNAGEEYAVRSRLASPPAEGRDLVVRFFHRRDVTAGVN